VQKPLLSVQKLTVSFPGAEVVSSVDFQLHQGRTFAILGESGSGKTTLAHGLLGLLPRDARVTGNIDFQGGSYDISQENPLISLRGKDIGMVFQEPMTSLNPLHTLFDQIAEPLILHRGLHGDTLLRRVRTVLDMVGFPQAKARLRAYPHELSGGERQRVMMAIALACDPHLLIADEPTTALDAILQKELLEQLQLIQKETGTAILFITHHLGLAYHIAHDMLLLRQGCVVEKGPAKRLLTNPCSEYGKALLSSQLSPRLSKIVEAPTILQVRNLTVRVPRKGRIFFNRHKTLLHNVSFSLQRGHNLGVVGGSGAGKTTLALALARLISSTGTVDLEGVPFSRLRGKALRLKRKLLQLIFQDPFSSLNPRHTVHEILMEGLRIHFPFETKAQRETRMQNMLAALDLPKQAEDRYPHAFSGGQRQRIAMARALVLRPRLLILDEPTSALDLTTQKNIVALLKEFQERFKLTYLLVSHDMMVVKSLCSHLCVLEKGHIVEMGETERVTRDPQHAYTRELIQAAEHFQLPSPGQG
jgi:microcin C transport system ATP-binding protein